jgi:hypothetical protein
LVYRLPSTNLDLAPPPKTVDGLAAVPIDIQHIAAKLTFDGATSSGSGDATLEFVLGPQGGCPIFDLRQTITTAWLDGAPLAVGQVAHHDFGGGRDAKLRVVDVVLPANSSHSLRVTYPLGRPDAPMAGGYRPAMTWTGPRLAFNFGFTDLRAGRYLEAWVPANLVFDQFQLDLELEVMNTPLPHVLITNGTVNSLGRNHWAVAFPAHFTALSPLLELRATDTLTTMADTMTLPVSGTSVTVQTWKFTESPIDLAAQISDLKAWLAANEASTGPYLHGGRFVACMFTDAAGMEYEGGTTSAVELLRHETFHSWWGRGLKPASQPDGWWDEAWDLYNDQGAIGLLPFDFSDPPVELSSRNPWERATSPLAYISGSRFFKGVASLIGLANLKAHMSAFYIQRNPRPATTGELEAFLVCRAGEPQLVDAFHRFVYGFADPAPAPDLLIKNDPGDPDADDSDGRFWDAADLWLRNDDDDGTTHQPVKHGQDNWFHARVRNRSATSTGRHFLVTFNVKPFAGMQFGYPTDFLPCIAAASGFDLGPGGSTIVKARWPAALIPPAGTHTCCLAAVLTRSDQPDAWANNTLAQKTLDVIDLMPGEWLVLPFVLNQHGVGRARAVTIELMRPPGWEELEAFLLHPSPHVFRSATSMEYAPAPIGPARQVSGARRAGIELDCGGGRMPDDLAPQPFQRAHQAAFEPSRNASIPLRLGSGGQLVIDLRLRVPQTATPGSVVRLDLIQREERRQRAIGGLTVELHVRRPDPTAAE